jgi:hypothetical protein
MLSLMETCPQIVAQVINNTLLPNKQRIQILKNVIFNRSTVGLLTGGRGSGKTRTMLWLAEKAHSIGLILCFVNFESDDKEIPQHLNPQFYDSVENCPPNSMIFVDEYGTKNKEWNSQENRDNTKVMVTSRHKNQWIIYSSQNFHHFPKDIRLLVDWQIIKKQSFTALSEEKDDMQTDVEIFMPTKPEEAYFKSDEIHMILQTPLPTWERDPKNSFQQDQATA